MDLGTQHIVSTEDLKSFFMTIDELFCLSLSVPVSVPDRFTNLLDGAVLGLFGSLLNQTQIYDYSTTVRRKTFRIFVLQGEDVRLVGVPSTVLENPGKRTGGPYDNRRDVSNYITTVQDFGTIYKKRSSVRALSKGSNQRKAKGSKRNVWGP